MDDSLLHASTGRLPVLVSTSSQGQTSKGGQLQADKNGDEILGSQFHLRARTRESHWALIRFQGRIHGGYKSGLTPGHQHTDVQGMWG